MAEKFIFEVGKLYYDKNGNLERCTKRTDKSIWFGTTRYSIKNYPNQYNNYIESTNYHSADNDNDIERQRIKSMQQLLACVQKVCDNEPCEYVTENESEIYELCNNLKHQLNEYLKI